ncbi:hypothetical protein E1180_09585 [Roseibium denhamense]|uniref:NHLP leader peptide family natural product n=1 Tax=Roseibium denhamense TaxID=76305 RepID=A0ABY1PLW2_9HYPH|nr:hypothetical protein [Roseibium denhamense]MTI05767.1 hypothetical protein [Roseibium denhamense]SMP36999.1 hypothetical protein SAMN06265374_4436 [Roseibium denhamense]
MSVQNSSAAKRTTGKQIGAMIQNEASRTELAANPQSVLADMGIHTNATVYADTADMVHLVIPAHIDQSRVAADDAAYFEELGLLALGLCMYSEQPDEPVT